MTRFVYAVRDTVSGQFSDLCTAVSDAQAIRGFKVQLNSPEFPRYLARDLSLVCIGEYDDQAGIVSGYEAFRPVSYGSDLLEPEKEKHD